MTRREAIAGATCTGLGAMAAAWPARSDAGGGWPLWESYAQRFLSADGRVIDFDADRVTTSEGQSYAAFFALVAGDRARFDRILAWTNEHLAGGELGAALPAWLWGRGDVLDSNSASDADVWLAYVLIEAGRLWKDEALTEAGRRLAATVARKEVRLLHGLGAMLLPGPEGFTPEPGVYQLNPSYLPLQVLLRLADHASASPWQRVARGAPAVLAGASRHGLVLDWVAYSESEGFRDAPIPRPEAKASYDAIRVYLWAGMLHPETPGRKQMLAPTAGMARRLEESEVPPAEVLADGQVIDPNGGVGFSAAVAPLLAALGLNSALETQRKRVQSFFDPESGLYGRPAKYYDQNLILFALGWCEGRFSFGPRGALSVGRLS